MGRPKHALKVYVLGWGGGEIFFHFSRLPNVFALCSFQVPNGFLIFSPTFSPYLLTFICLGKWCLPFTYIGGPKGKDCTIQNKAFCFGEFSLLYFFGVMGQSNWHVAQKKAWEAPHLINRRDDYLCSLNQYTLKNL
jgi:hypothetical protein